MCGDKKMKILFKNKTKYSEELYTKYCIFHNETNFFFAKMYNIIIVGLLIFLLVVQTKNHNYDIIILIGLSITLFILWRLFYPIYLGRKEISSEKITSQKEYYFTFYDNYFTIENDKYITKVKYNKLFRVRITDEYSYLYTDRRYSYILDNNGFTYGSLITFKSFMHKKCGWKYKYYDIIKKNSEE